MAIKTKELLQVSNQLNESIPETWTTISIKDFAEIVNGGAFKSNLFNKTKGIRLVRIRDLTQKKNHTYYDGEYDKKYLIDSGDFLVGMDGDFIGTEWTSGKALLNQRVCKITINNDIIHPKFFRLGINMHLEKIHQATSYLTVAHLSSDTINYIEFPLPPLNEQKRIVGKIEELFSKLSFMEITLNNIQLQLKQYRQSLLESAFNGNLTRNWRKEHISILESAYDLIERIKIGSHIPINDNLPEKWASTVLKNLFEVKVGSTPSRTNSSFWNGDIPWISSGQVKNCEIYESKEKISKDGFDNSSLKIFPPETVLLAMIGEGKTRGQVAILKISATTNQNIASILCADSEILSKYIYFWFLKRYEETRKIGSGGMQKALNGQRVKEMPLILAPIREQEQIVLHIEQNLSLLQNTEYEVKSMLNQLGVLRSTILKQAFEGKLIPQDPNDEPAEILLQKIKQEKQKIISQNTKTRKKK